MTTENSNPGEQLSALAEAAKKARLSPADEEKAKQLLKQWLTTARAGTPGSIETMLGLPWSIGVKAVAEVWPELKVTARRQFLALLAEQTSDTGKRLRLSLARGILDQDPKIAAKLAVAVCAEMQAAENGFSSKDRQVFANVLIGKGKPWLLHLPIADWKPAEANVLIQCAVVAGLQSSPFTQLSIVRWIAEAGRLAKLPAESVEVIAHAVKRWQPKWQKELKEAVADLPGPIVEALAQPASPPPQPVRPVQAPTPAPRPVEPKRASAPAPKPEPRPSRERQPQMSSQQPRVSQPPGPRQRETTPSAASSFDLTRTLRDIESHVGRLRAELHQAQTALKRREEGTNRNRAAARPEEVLTTEDVDALRRHNVQLQETVADLRQQLEDLAGDHEDRAASLQEGDELRQFKALLGIKLQTEYTEFKALRRESPTEVVRKHFRDLLDQIFEVLQAEGVVLKENVS